LQLLLNPSRIEIIWRRLRCETSRNFRDRKNKYLKE
jgi:hypothetical protein